MTMKGVMFCARFEMIILIVYGLEFYRNYLEIFKAAAPRIAI